MFVSVTVVLKGAYYVSEKLCVFGGEAGVPQPPQLQSSQQKTSMFVIENYLAA